MEALSQTSRKAPALLLSLVMVTSICIPTAAWGAGDPTEPKADPVEVATADELASAVAAGGEIILTDNVVLSSTVTVAAGISVELDLAGHSVSVGSGNAFLNSGYLTIKDSIGGGLISGLNAINNAGQLTLQGGTLEGTNAGIFVGSGSVSINGGTVRGSGNENNAIYLKSGSVEVTDGAIEAPSGGSAVKGIAGALLLSGGKFKPGSSLFATSGVNTVFGEGMDFSPEPNADGYYEVGAHGSAATINGVAYESLSAALAAVAPGESVELQRDVLLSEPVSIGKSCTLDCDGHALKAQFVASRLELFADVTIKNGTLESADDSIQVRDPAQVVLDGMKVVSGNRAVYASGGSVHIKSGSYTTTAQGVYALSVGNSTAQFTIDSATVTNGPGTGQLLVMTNKGGVEKEVDDLIHGEEEWIGQTCTVYSTENMVQVPDGTKYASISDALAAGQTELTLTRTVVKTDEVTIPAGTNLTLHLGANRYGGNIVNNGSLTLDADGLRGGVKGSITNNGTLVVNGGSYATDVSSFVGERYVAVLRDGIWEVTEAVARIGEVKYATIAQAIEEASGTSGNPTLITLMRDSLNADEVDIENRFLTLDLAGFTLRGRPVGSEGTKTAGLRVQQGSVVTVKNGTLDAPKGDQSYYPVNNQGTLTLQNVKVTGESINALVRNNGNLTMTDCTVKNDNAIEPGGGSGHDGSFGLLCQYYEYAGAGTMTTKISGSTISGGYGGIKVIGGPDSDHIVSVEISGDAVTGGSAGALVAENGSQGNPAKIALTGGAYSGVLDKAYYDEDVYEQLEPDATGLGKIVPRSYALSYDLAGGALPEGASNPESYTWFDDEITLVNPAKAGFDFMGWKEGTTDPKLEVKIPAHSIGDHLFMATWKERTDTPYEVVHAFQDVEGDGYTNDSSLTQHLKGTTNADTAAEALEAPGFTAQPVAQKAIAPDGSTVVEVRYDRNVHHVSYEYRGNLPAGASTLPEMQACRYGAAVSVAPAATAPGYDFVGWDSSDELVMGDADVVLYGSFVARGDTAYKVEHYQQNLDGSYRLADTDELAGKTDSEAVAAPKAYAGFSWNEDAPETQVSGTIAGDGGLVLKLYYDRESYRLTYAYQGDVPVGVPAVPREQVFRFGEVVTLAQAPSMTGYDFSGWSREEGFAMPAEGVTVTGSWTPRTDAGYTVRYMLDGTERQLLDDKVVDGCTFGTSYTEEAPAITGYSVKGSSIQQVTIDAYGKTVVFSYAADAARIVFESNGGSEVDALEGVTNQVVVDRSLPAPTREGYAFAGWHDNKALGGQPIAQLPETFSAGTTTFWAKWNAVPLPDIAPNIQVELPTPMEGADVSSAVAEKAVAAVARHAKDALDAIGNGEVPKGMNEDDANRIAKALEGAPEDRTTVIVTIKADPRDESEVADHEKAAIAGASASGEEATMFLDLSVTMTVKVESEDGEKVVEDVPLSEVTEPMLFEVHVDPALIAGKSVRIAHVHDGVTEVIVPESVDYEQGVVTFYASRFSTYALLTAEEVEVRFESNGGSVVASQTVAFGGKVQKPQDPTRTGYTFAGWFAEEGLESPYDFDQAATAPLTLYAKWTKNDSGGVEPGGETPGDDQPDADDTKPAKPANPSGTDSGKDGSHKDAATKAGSLKATGDNSLATTAALALGGCLAALLAFAATFVRRTRRSS